MAKVKVSSHGIPHFLASCTVCDWTYQDHNDREIGYRAIRKHVLRSSHTVHLEVGIHTDYSLENKAAEHPLHSDDGEALAESELSNDELDPLFDII